MARRTQEKAGEGETHILVLLCHLFELAHTRLELLELCEPAAALLLDARLDLADPPTLELDPLLDDLLLEALVD